MSYSISALLTRVEALEKQMLELQPTPRTDLATILGKRADETIEYAARRVVRLLESAEDTLNRVHAERDKARQQRDAAIKEKTKLLADVEDAIVIMDGYRNLPLSYTVQVVVAARNDAMRERDEVMQLLASIMQGFYGTIGIKLERPENLAAMQFLINHGRAVKHLDGTFSIIDKDL